MACALAGLIVAGTVRGGERGPAPPDSAAVPGAVPADSLPVRLDPIATLPSARGELVEPAGLAIDAFGRIFVSDAAGHRILRFDASGAPLGQAGALGSAPGELRRPGAVALLGTLSVAVLDVENRRVVLYDLFDRLQGVLIDFEDRALREELGRIDARALASDRGGALYVADADRDRLLVFDISGRFVRALGGYGEGAGSFRGLAGVAAGRRGEIVTSERVPRRIQRLDPSGAPRAAWKLPPGGGRGALAVAMDDSARVAVADEAAGALWVFDRDGRPIAAYAGLERPRAVAFAPDGTLIVAESAAGRLRRFALRAGKE